MRRFVTLTALTALGTAVSAQEPEPADPEETPRRYAIEVIIFEYAEEVSVGSEIFVPDAEPEVAADADSLPDEEDPPTAPYSEPEPRAASGEEPRDLAAFEFAPLPEGAMTLGEAMRKLRVLDVYRPVVYTGWSQTGLPREQAPVIDLSRVASPPPGLDGSFTLYVSRFLHLVVDLTLEDEASDVGGAEPEAEETVSFGDERVLSGGDSRPYRPVRYRIHEDRIFKSGELRYFDHPKFGVLVRVTRLDEPGSDGSRDQSAPSSAAFLGG